MFPPNKQSAGYQIGSSIIGDKGSGRPKAPKAPKTGESIAHVPSPHISITPATNGFQVSHAPQSPEGGKDYQKEQTHVFTSPHEAHAHVGRLLGISHSTSGE